jgi:hypothetical protein
MRKYRVTEIPKSANTAECNAVITEISLAVFAEMLLCCYTAVPRYRDTAIILTGRDGA